MDTRAPIDDPLTAGAVAVADSALPAQELPAQELPTLDASRRVVRLRHGVSRGATAESFDATLATLPAPSPSQATWQALLNQLARQCRNAAPLILVDLFAGALCLLAADRCAEWLTSGAFSRGGNLTYLLPALLAPLAVLGLYPGIGVSPVVELRKLSLGSISLVVAVLAVLLHAGQPLWPSILFAAVLGGALLLTLPLCRAALRAWLARQSWWGEPVLIFGGGPLGGRVHEMLLREASRGMRSLGVIDETHRYWNSTEEQTTNAYLGPPEVACEVAMRHDVQWAVIACNEPHTGDAAMEDDALGNEHTLECLSRIPNRLFLSSAGLPSLWTESRECGGAVAMHVSERLMMPWPQFIKRSVDVTLSALAGVLLLPLLGLVALLVATSSPGPVFFAHSRLGRDGRRFLVWKFRTMYQNADNNLRECLESDSKLHEEWARDQKLRRDPRVTLIGRFLRKTSLDELPQLWNVIRGDMSLVGPRPIVEDEVAKYSHVYPLYTRVRPGITGMWQISGRNRTTYEERVALDNYYVRNWSPWLDTYILARTVRTVLLREGAY